MIRDAARRYIELFLTGTGFGQTGRWVDLSMMASVAYSSGAADVKLGQGTIAWATAEVSPFLGISGIKAK